MSLKIAAKATTTGKVQLRAITTTTVPTTTAAKTLVQTMIALRSQRSARTPAIGVNSMSGRCHSAWMIAVCSMDCVSVHTTHITARLKKASPNVDTVCPLQSSTNARLRNSRR